MSPTVTPRGPQRFYWRAFTSFLVILGFTVLVATAIGLYVSPPGRIANWSGWTFIGLTKTQWQSVHLVFGLLFVVAGAFHLFFNWRVLLSYLRVHVGAGLRRKWELVASLAATAALVILSAADVPPVSAVAAYRETVANSWATPATEPPVPHAELLTLAQFTDAQKLPLDKALGQLAASGFTPSGDMTLAQIAASLQVTPQEIYRRLGTAKPAPSATAGGGMGWKTLRAVSVETGVPVETAVSRLAAAGISAEADKTLREIASQNDRHAPELVPIITGTSR